MARLFKNIGFIFALISILIGVPVYAPSPSANTVSRASCFACMCWIPVSEIPKALKVSFKKAYSLSFYNDQR